MEERGRGGEKGVEKGGEGLEGEDFPGKFRETPRPPDPTRTSFAQNQETATRSGAITYPLPPPCLRPYEWIEIFFHYII